MNEDKYKFVRAERRFWESSTFWLVFYMSLASFMFLLFILPAIIMANPENKLEYYVAQEIETDLPEEVRSYDGIVFDLQEIKEQRKVLDEGAEWKVYSVKFRCLDEESKTITNKDYVAFVYYKFVKGEYYRKGYYAILDCDLAKVN